MVLAAVGVDHDRLVKCAQEHMVDCLPVWQSKATKRQHHRLLADASLAQYTGGLVTIPKDLSNASLGPTPLPNLVHLTLGLEAVSHQHPVRMCLPNPNAY